MSRRVDFDAFRAEQKKDPVILVIGGQEIELAAELPATLVLDALGTDDEAEVSNETIVDLLHGAFGGEERLKTIVREHDIGFSELADLARMVVAAYGGGEGNRQARRATARRARKGNG